MIARLLRRFVWAPFEVACRILPLWPFRVTIVEVEDGVLLLRTDNALVRALGRFAGGYDYACSYVIDGTLLVDTSFPWARRSLARAFVQLELKKTLQWALNTHYHEDHIGNNDLVLEQTSARVVAHRDAVNAIRYPRVVKWYRRFLFGPGVASRVEPAPTQLWTPRFRFDVLDMPGHCPGHLCLFERERGWLFGGDLYVSAELDSQLDDVDGPAWIASLERALACRPRALFDAHGTVILGEDAVASALTRKRDMLVAIGAEAVRVASEGPQSIESITRKVFRRGGLIEAVSLHEGWMSLITASDFSRSNVVASFVKCVPSRERGAADTTGAIREFESRSPPPS
jgi:glyoxylase-like metal-dependent hydrolase (beta-lactamase superfamily II)